MWEASFREISAVVVRQQGLITSAQAKRIGVDQAALDHFRQAGLLVELDQDVFQVTSGTLGPRYAYPYAAWLSILPGVFSWERPQAPAGDAVLSHGSACRLHGIGAVSAPVMEFTSPEERPEPRATRIYVSPLRPEDVMVVAGVPVTTPHRTLVDIVRDWFGHEEVGRAITDAVRRDLVDLGELFADLVPLAREHHFPAHGRAFLSYLLPNLSPEPLSVRNLRAYALLAAPDPVAQMSEQVRRVVEDARATFGVPDTAGPEADDGALHRGIAAEIVGSLGLAAAAVVGDHSAAVEGQA